MPRRPIPLPLTALALHRAAGDHRNPARAIALMRRLGARRLPGVVHTFPTSAALAGPTASSPAPP